MMHTCFELTFRVADRRWLVVQPLLFMLVEESRIFDKTIMTVEKCIIIVLKIPETLRSVYTYRNRVKGK